MKLTSKEIFNAAITLMSSEDIYKFTDSNLNPNDMVIKRVISIVKRTAELIEDDDEEKRYDLNLIFKDFKCDQEGLKRIDIEDYLKEKTGYTSNRVMQQMINQALADGYLQKNLRTRKYHPGKKCPTA